ncbi:MAG: nuclear transport factor 2 family protein [Acidimicrobiales bacterium]
MDDHPGVQRMRDYLARFGDGDVESVREFYSPDVLWHVGGYHSLSGDYRGQDALMDYFRRVREMTGGTLRLQPRSILASDKYTSVFTQVQAERDGRTLDVLMAQVFKVGPDGRWAEYWAVPEDQDHVDAFWS